VRGATENRKTLLFGRFVGVECCRRGLGESRWQWFGDDFFANLGIRPWNTQWKQASDSCSQDRSRAAIAVVVLRSIMTEEMARGGWRGRWMSERWSRGEFG
jgi:hypothetical protein